MMTELKSDDLNRTESWRQINWIKVQRIVFRFKYRERYDTMLMKIVL